MADEIDVTKKVADAISDNAEWLVPMVGLAVLEWLRRMRNKLMSSVSVEDHKAAVDGLQKQINEIMPMVEDKVARCHQQLRHDISNIGNQIGNTDHKVDQILFHLIGKPGDD